MPLWKITAKYSNNAPCKNKRQKLEKGMFVETSTASTTPPLGQTREHPMLAQLFMSKYKLYLPDEEELRAEIEAQKRVFLAQHEDDM